MKILFLDHDGVICLPNNWGSRFAKKVKFDDFDEEAVSVLNEIIDETDCEIVVSSDWRFHTTLKGLRELYKERGIKKLPISMTSTSKETHPSSLIEKNRANEILRWVNDRVWDGSETWVAVDDLNLYDYLDDSNYIKTVDLFGITQMGVKEEIVNKLNRWVG